MVTINSDRLQLAAARDYVQSRFFPPLPVEYGDLLVTALREAREYGLDSHVNLDPNLNPLPRAARVDDDGDLYVTAGELVDILRASHLLEDDNCPVCGREEHLGVECDDYDDEYGDTSAELAEQANNPL